MRRYSNGNPIGSVFGFLGRVIDKGWEYVNGPSKTLCDEYSSQAQQAQEKMGQADISRRERRFWRKERNSAIAGISNVHRENNDTFVKVICGIGVSAIAFLKLFNSKK